MRPGQSDRLDRGVPSDAQVEHEGRSVDKSSQRSWVFVDQRTRKRIPGVRVYSPGLDGESIDLDAIGLARADASGRLLAGPWAAESSWRFAYATGFELKKLPEHDAGLDTRPEIEVELAAAHAIRLFCRDQNGRPVEDASVVVTRRRLRFPEGAWDTRVPLPGSNFPYWASVSDENGMAVVAGLRSGKYHIHVFSETSVSIDERFDGRSKVGVPLRDQTVVLSPIVAAAWLPPQRAGMDNEDVASSVDSDGQFVRAALDVRRIASAYFDRDDQMFLARIEAGVLRRGASRDVRIEAILSDGLRCAATARLRPLKAVRLTTLVPEGFVPMRQVRLSLKGHSKKPQQLPLELRSGKFRAQAIASCNYKRPPDHLLPCGTWTVVPRWLSKQHSATWKPVRIDVTSGPGLLDKAVEIKPPVLWLTYRLDAELNNALELCPLVFEHESGASFEPELVDNGLGQIVLPPGKYRVRSKRGTPARVDSRFSLSGKTVETFEIR